MIYSTKQGDTFDSIAFSVLGNEYYFLDIIELNQKYRHVIVFSEGIQLVIPKIEEDLDDDVPEWLIEEDAITEEDEFLEASEDDS